MNQPAELIDIDLTYDYLEERFEAHAAQCDSPHTHASGSPTGPCSVEAQFWVKSPCPSVVDRLWCSSRREQWLSTGFPCKECKRSSLDCWRVIPV